MAAGFAAAGITSGALVGFAAGALWSAAGLPAAGPAFVSTAAAGAVVADVVYRRRGRPHPPALRRQVPQAWSRLFPPVTVALLYGARLGVGPLTILPTWLWWAALVTGAAGGPVLSTAAGALFAATRALLTLGLAERARPAMAARMARLRAREPAAATVCAAVALVCAAAPWWA